MAHSGVSECDAPRGLERGSGKLCAIDLGGRAVSRLCSIPGTRGSARIRIVAILMLASLAVIVAFWRSSANREPDGSGTSQAPASRSVPPRERVSDREADPVSPIDPPDAAEMTPAGSEKVPIVLEGLVFDESGKLASAGVEVERVATPGIERGTTRTAGDGSWRMAYAADATDRIEFALVRARDTRTGAMSAAGWTEVDSHGGTSIVYLRLRPVVRVTGRAVDAAGSPVPGATVRLLVDHEPALGVPDWASNEGMDETFETRVGESGAFEFHVRRSGRLRVAARRDDHAAFGASGWVDIPDTGDLDVGEIVPASDAVSEWVLRFRDASGTAVSGVRLRFDRDGLFELPEMYRPWATTEIVSGEQSDVRLSFACRPDPVWIAVGSSRHVSRVVRLDCSVPGEVVGTIVLVPRGELRVAVRHPDAESLLDAGVALETDLASVAEATPAEGVDARTGAPVEFPQGFMIWTLLESSLADAPAERTGARELSLSVPPDQDIRLTLRVGDEIVGESTAMVRSGSGVATTTIDVAEGRAVRIDWSRARAWFEQLTPKAAWVSSYAVWSVDGREARVDGTAMFVLPRGVRPTRMLHSDTLVWMHPGTDTLAFGFVESGARLHDQSTVVREVSRERLDLSAVTVTAPSPGDGGVQPVLVTVAVHRSGEPFSHAGLPVIVARADPDDGPVPKGSPRGSVDGLTDPTGRVRFRLLDGRYALSVSPSYDPGASPTVATWRRLDLRPGQGRVDVDLNFALAR